MGYGTTLTPGRAFGLAHGPLNLIGGASYAWNDLNTRCDISSIGLNQLLKGSYKGRATQVFGELGWRHTFGDTQTVSRMAFEGGREFSVQGTPIARDAALVELGGALSLGKRSTLSVAYNGQLSKHAKEHTGRVNLQMRF